MDTKMTLVLGAKGKTGSRVAEQLAAQGVPVRLGSRAADPPFDWEDADTWAPVLRNVESVYITYQPDLAFPGAADRVRSFAELAVANGVRRLELLSGPNEEGALLGEQAVRESGAEWTIVRSSFFAQNFSEGFWVDAVRGGVVAGTTGDVVEPFVDVDDIAEIVVEALTGDKHVGQLYEVTGPRLLSFTEAVGEIARATGRDISYLQISPEAFESALVDEGLPASEARELTELFTTVLDGRSEYLTDGVQRALGREPRDFGDLPATPPRPASGTRRR
jgi:uncharacterized protein YbjT (DUF2867 family)